MPTGGLGSRQEIMIDLNFGCWKNRTECLLYLYLLLRSGTSCPVVIDLFNLFGEVQQKFLLQLLRHLGYTQVIGIESNPTKLTDLAIPVDYPPIGFARPTICY